MCGHARCTSWVENGSTNRASKLISPERNQVHGQIDCKEVVRIQSAITQKLKSAAMNVIVPDRVTIVTTVPPVFPYSALKLLVITFIS